MPTTVRYAAARRAYADAAAAALAAAEAEAAACAGADGSGAATPVRPVPEVPAVLPGAGRAPDRVLWWRLVRLVQVREMAAAPTGPAERLAKYLALVLPMSGVLDDVTPVLDAYARGHKVSMRTAWTDLGRLVAAGWLAQTRSPANVAAAGMRSSVQGPGSGRRARYVLTLPDAVLAQLRETDRTGAPAVPGRGEAEAPGAADSVPSQAAASSSAPAPRGRTPSPKLSDASLDALSSLEGKKSPFGLTGRAGGGAPSNPVWRRGWVLTHQKLTTAQRRDASATLAGAHHVWRTQIDGADLPSRQAWQRLLPLIAAARLSQPDADLIEIMTVRVRSARRVPELVAWRLWQVIRNPQPAAPRPRPVPPPRQPRTPVRPGARVDGMRAALAELAAAPGLPEPIADPVAPWRREPRRPARPPSARARQIMDAARRAEERSAPAAPVVRRPAGRHLSIVAALPSASRPAAGPGPDPARTPVPAPSPADH